MKVYELINELSKCPAGAEVNLSTLMTLAEFTARPIADNIDGANAYCIEGRICEVDQISEKHVFLHV